MRKLVVDVNAKPGAELDAWMRRVSGETIQIELLKESGPTGHPMVQVWAETAHDLDQWLRNHYVLDSAGPALEEDVQILMDRAVVDPSKKKVALAMVLGGMSGAGLAILFIVVLQLVFHMRVW